MRNLIILFTFLVTQISFGQRPLTPDEIYGELFIKVQTSQIFPDSKTFVDCIPKRDPSEILKDYHNRKKNLSSSLSLRKFIEENFNLPATTATNYSSSNKNIREHINALWPVLTRIPPASDSCIKNKWWCLGSLLPLNEPYIVPGGRFREVYYWDSYFTMLGLKESGSYEMMENMIRNFSDLVLTYGHIPNGNRTYYLSRSQPPFFSLMVDLLSEIKSDTVYSQYRTALEKEFAYWQDIAQNDPSSMYRYWDNLEKPRQESYKEDLATNLAATKLYESGTEIKNVDSFSRRFYRHLRAAAASGWDFSSRWFSDQKKLETTRTADIAPVDLHCLLFNLNTSLEKCLDDSVEKTLRINRMRDSAIKAYSQTFYNEEIGWYCDYDLHNKKVLNVPTLAGMFPLFFRLADEKKVPAIVDYLKKNFIKEGGVVTTLSNTGQQWDAPNGWAPLQWITIIGLENYGYHQLAKDIALRWINLNKKVFNDTGKLMEKYNVVDTSLQAGGGEYPSQDGFGWTNGVLLALMNKYKVE